MCADFPYDMLYSADSQIKPLTVLAAWVDAAIVDDVGVPAAIGPIGPDGISNFMDYYWHQGWGVGPSIPASLIKGWWYVVGTDSTFKQE